MKGKRVTLFKGLFTVAVISVITYAVIFFFFPNVSIKYFGSTFDFNKAVEETVASALFDLDDLSEEEKKEFDNYLSSTDGRAFIKGISEAIRGGRKSIEEFSHSESFSSFVDTASSILSAESLSKLYDNIEDTASQLLEKIE